MGENPNVFDGGCRPRSSLGISNCGGLTSIFAKELLVSIIVPRSLIMKIDRFETKFTKTHGF